MESLNRIAELFRLHGERNHIDTPDGSVTLLAHALQCAQLAEWDHAEPALVAAALLHDIGHLGADAPARSGFDDLHELRAIGLLDADFGPRVIEPIRLHVQAKRYLAATEPGYERRLSRGSARSLLLQGGPMSRDEALVFKALPGADEAIRLRRWDDAANVPGKRTPPLAYYLELIADLCTHDADRRERIGIGALDLA